MVRAQANLRTTHLDRIVGLTTCEGTLFSKSSQSVFHDVDRSGCHRARERAEKVHRAEVEEAINQARMIARETTSVRMEMAVLRKTPKTMRAVKLEITLSKHARKCWRV